MTDPIIVQIVGSASGDPTPHDGRYVVRWNSNVHYGTLAVDSTPRPEGARRFADIGEATSEWRAISHLQPRRPDGKPNRPLTALTITFSHIK
jgi:hypothetical protein